MALLEKSELAYAREIGSLIYANPFAPERFELEKRLLGSDYQDDGTVWNRNVQADAGRDNVERLHLIAREWADKLRARLDRRELKAGADEWQLYWYIVMYHLFESYREPLVRLLSRPDSTHFPQYRDFEADFNHYLKRAGDAFHYYSVERTLAIFFQIHRAFHHIFEFLIGGTEAAGELRAAVWQSIFSWNLERYNRALFDRMNNITTLITGESGTGKEVVARAIAFSQYIPFDPATQRFACDYKECFHPLHLSAMPATLLESELFGHRKGAFTGALEDRAGYLENCSEYGTVFLDEIGEITPETQVKLLRILQNRRFRRLGDNEEREFRGKILAATNRDLSGAIAAGRFREDLYYRLCADMIVTVPLRRILDGRRVELEKMIRLSTARLIGEDEAESFCVEAAAWIEEHLGSRYAWPGNVRELEQCLRNLLIRRTYHPARAEGPEDWLERARRGDLALEEVIREYCRHVRGMSGSDSEAAARLGVDRRTVAKNKKPK